MQQAFRPRCHFPSSYYVKQVDFSTDSINFHCTPLHDTIVRERCVIGISHFFNISSLTGLLDVDIFRYNPLVYVFQYVSFLVIDFKLNMF